MVAFYEDSHIKVYNKSCTDMSELADNSIQCCVTSPPYWGLRKYDGNQDLIWGGDKNCEHIWKETPPRRSRKATDIKNLDSKEATNGGNLGQELTATNTCQFCNAWRGSFGLEPTPELYVAHSIEILREIKRVLRPDGVAFWNVGDSYMAHAGDRNKVGGFQGKANKARIEAESSMSMIKRTNKVLKDKDLCLIPFRVAIAAQEDGWWIRSVIIWNKPNPMPESVRDRPTDAYEHILMLTKSSKYYWDIEAVREQYTEPLNRWGGDTFRKSSHKYIDTFEETGDNGGIGKIGATSMFRAGRPVRPDEAGRNLRNVWTFPTQPYPEAHFATFPEKLPETCIKAATPEYGCCNKCGKPYERIIESTPMVIRRTEWGNNAGNRTASSGTMVSPAETKTLGWQQACKCENSKPAPSLILDPFAGSGTTLWVAKKLNKKAIGYELPEKYCQLIIERNRQQVIL